MSDRYKSLTVALDGDYLFEDIEDLMTAIRQMKGVAEVTFRETTSSDWIARQRVRTDMANKFLLFWEEMLGMNGDNKT